MISIWDADYSHIIYSEKEPAEIEGITSGCVINTSRLNNAYRFDTFVVAKSNQEAFNSVKSASIFPGGSYNPLLIYGDTGVGKTHLIQAAAWHITEHDPNLEILYISAEMLTDKLAEAVESGTFHLLRGGILGCDVLIVDDIQYMLWQDVVQEAFLDLVESLYENKRQVIIAGNYAATEMMGLENRIKETIAKSAAVEIKQPEYEIKKTALMNLANKQGIEVTRDLNQVIDYIAHIEETNLYEVQGALIRVISYARFSGEPITLNNARYILEPLSDEEIGMVLSLDEDGWAQSTWI